MMRNLFAIIILGASVSTPAAPAAQESDAEHAAVRLISEQTSATPGSKVWLGIQLKHAPHWHTYWVNPGDSGLTTKLTWSVPEDFLPSDIAWPTPKRFDVGGLFNFGYDGEVVLPVAMTVPATAKPGTNAHLSVLAKWLVCHEECVPGKAVLSIDLPIAEHAAPNSQWQKAFDAAHASQPQTAAWTGEAHLDGDHVVAVLHGVNLPQAAKGLDVFPIQAHVVAYSEPQIELHDGTLTLFFAKSDYYTFTPTTLDLILHEANAPAWSVSLPFHVDTSTNNSKSTP
jgi:DsbC/DsbD-like thiol-disulfide interchange protein